ncbi:unnamed protein product [Discula destructiva]
MQYTVSAATFLALVSAVQAQVADFDPITKPLKDEAVPACSNYVIDWDYSTAYPGTVTLQLLQGATPSTLQLGAVIAKGVDNSLGAYTWAVNCGLGADATYGIKITYDSDASGVTFQYSNPFQITKSAAGAAPAPSSAPAASYPAVSAPAGHESTAYYTEYHTVVSCAPEVTDCPARSTAVEMTSYPVATVTTDECPAPTAPAATATPMYPAGNATSYAGPVGGTVTLSTQTAPGGGSGATGAATTAPIASAPVTAGAGRVALGGVAVVAGLVAAVFAL